MRQIPKRRACHHTRITDNVQHGKNTEQIWLHESNKVLTSNVNVLLLPCPTGKILNEQLMGLLKTVTVRNSLHARSMTAALTHTHDSIYSYCIVKCEERRCRRFDITLQHLYWQAPSFNSCCRNLSKR